MLSRTQTVKRLIEIRKIIRKNELKINEADLNNLKKEIDNLLTDVIGAPEKLQYKVNEILTKAIKEEIKTETALVAIHELVNEGLEPVKYKKNKKKKNTSPSDDLYEKRIKKTGSNIDIKELEKRGWNS
ncbi:MAG: hypothetical protein ACOC21_03030 [Halanaerobiales bacterium]